MNTKTHNLLLLCLAGLPLLLIGGCNAENKNAANVQGTVTVDGELATSGTVVFHSVDKHPACYGSIRKDGSFALQVGQGNRQNPDYNDIPVGEYVATVTIRGASYEDPNQSPGSPPKAGPLLIARKYTSKGTSPLKFKVTAQPKPNVVSIEVGAFEPGKEDSGTGSEIQEEGVKETVESGKETPPETEPTETEKAVQDILTDAKASELDSAAEAAPQKEATE